MIKAVESSEIHCQLDHLVVCASTLANGVSWFKQLCGVQLPEGGSHPLMATHNHLSALSENTFLEIIAIDPAAPKPAGARWFNLDSEAFQAQLRQSPRLATWVLATSDLAATLDILKAQGIDAGEPVALTRGNLHWQIALRTDGTLACDGVFPILIQWPEDVNPVDQMQNQGLRLQKLHLQHPQSERIKVALQLISADHLVELTTGKPDLHAQLSAGNDTFQLYY